ncbi:MAG TPA: tripartite tricarboxylate transporter substrate binding protein [Burkholderiales bacterium]|nr:tripartite tricarboxylate transporter substrate binding protein [Burkholderiales bacterium]
MSTVRILSFAVIWILAGPALSQSTVWAPTRPVELVVGVGPGGGVDRTARLVQKIVQERKLVPVPVNVVNKPGGGGTIAHAYVGQRAGDAHHLEITATSLLTNNITGRTAFSHRDVTPVAMLYDEYLGFAVAANSPIADAKGLVAALKERIDGVPIGIATSAGNTNHIGAGLIAKAAGAEVKKLKVVVFNSGGESMTALLGGHVAVVVTPSANLIPHMQAGRMRVLAVSAPKRLAGALATVPTWKEHGIDAVVANWRPVVGARSWTPAQIAYWEAVFAKVVASEDWTAEIERSGGVPHFMGSRELGAFFERQHGEFRAILGELGLAK